MEYQKMKNLLENTPNQSSKYGTYIWAEVNNGSRGTYNTNSQIKLKTTMLKLSFCDYNAAYILVSGTIIITGARRDTSARKVDKRSKKVIFKFSVPFTDRISKINNTQVDNAKDLNVVMPMYNLIEYSDNYSKRLGI